jgi:hypothetical protein
MASMIDSNGPGFSFGLDDIEVNSDDDSAKGAKDKGKNRKEAGNELTSDSQNAGVNDKGIVYMILYITGFVCGRIVTQYLLGKQKKRNSHCSHNWRKYK